MCPWWVFAAGYLSVYYNYFDALSYMSDSKLQKYIDRPFKSGSARKKLFLLADSKGKYLLKHTENIEKNAGVKILYDCQPGRRLVHGLNWLQENRGFLRKSETSMVLAIWLGTCDLTCKRGKAIALRHQTDEGCYDYIRRQIERYLHFLAWYPQLSVVFLTVPPYSIVRWDISRDLPITDQTKSDDLVLYHRVALINDFITQCNDRRGVRSPVFKLDLLNDRKRAGREVRKSITFRQYLDGIHPGPLLAKAWLKRIVEMTVIES